MNTHSMYSIFHFYVTSTEYQNKYKSLLQQIAEINTKQSTSVYNGNQWQNGTESIQCSVVKVLTNDNASLMFLFMYPFVNQLKKFLRKQEIPSC